MTFVLTLAVVVVVGVIALGAAGERRRQAEFGRIDRRHLRKYS